MKKFLVSGKYVQYIASISGALSCIPNGINQAWTSPYLPQLTKDTSEIPTTSEEGSWCVSMGILGAPLGAILSGFLINKIGRKNTITFLASFLFLGFLAIGFARNIIQICAARFLIAMISGGHYTAVPMYIAEICDPNVRGILTLGIDVASILGSLFINAIGPFTSIFTSSLICTIFPALHLLTFIWMPKSPYYLIREQRFDEAKTTLMNIRGKTDVEAEMNELCEAVKRQESNKKSRVIDLILVKSNRKAVLIFVTLAITKQFSGHIPVVAYTTTIFETANGNVDPTISVIIYSIVRFISTLSALTIVDKFGRRVIISFSAAGCALCLFLEGLYFYLQHINHPSISQLNWLPITALLGYNIIFSNGVSYAPVLLLSEIFPTNIKAIALSLGDCCSAFLGAASSKFFQITMDNFGMFAPFWAYSFTCVCGLILILKFLPETRGKSLEEIQLQLIRK